MANTITVEGSSLEQQAFHCLTVLQEKELALPEDTRPDNVSIETDFEEGTVEITLTLPITVSSSGGQMTLSAQEFIIE